MCVEYFQVNIGYSSSESAKSIQACMLLLLLSRLSRVRLCATPESAAHQAPPSLEFSRQEHCSGLPFPSPMHESKKWKWSHSVVSDPMDCSPPGSSVHEIFQARVLEWGALPSSQVCIYLLYNVSNVNYIENFFKVYQKRFTSIKY